METNALDGRRRFTHDFLSGHWSMTELCQRYGVSRPTGYKWLGRYRVGGDAALVNESRAPHHWPQRTDVEIELLLLAARHEVGWGAKKL